MKSRKILFLCTGNSARSILAEFLLRKKDPYRFTSYSAGAAPKPSPHPMALRVLRETFRIEPEGARSKSWDEYADLRFDFVITVCDNARESCPVWPGQPIVAHWGSPDPAIFEGPEAEQQRLFEDVGWQISRRLDLLLNLPVDKLEELRVNLETATRSIGEQEKL